MHQTMLLMMQLFVLNGSVTGSQQYFEDRVLRQLTGRAFETRSRTMSQQLKLLSAV
jgi:hypothetical protein